MNKKRIILLVATFLIAGSCFARPKNTPKNIILMIGDGMGTAQLTAGLVSKGQLNMERMPVGGSVKTFAANSLVTDSAASATAFATGKKANNGAISITPDGKKAKTLFEYAEEKGLSTGVAVTCNVTHATPAAFAAHVKKRSMSDEIAKHISQAGLDVIFGGGLSSFTKRKDGKDLLEDLSKKGMQIAKSEDEFAKLSDNKPAAALLAPDHLPPVDDRKVSLSLMTAKAISILSKNKKGFVLLVEASQIDWAGHKNKPDWIISETIDFDNAIGTALDFAENNSETLVVVTSDHETGGMTTFNGSLKNKTVSEIKFSSDGHSSVMVPLFASGPGAEAFGGIKDNTDIGKLLIDIVKKK